MAGGALASFVVVLFMLEEPEGSFEGGV